MKQYGVMKEVHFCYGHRLLNYEGKCKNLHGHNARVQIELASDKCDERGILVDFGDIANVFEKWLDENLDHKMLLCKEDPFIKEFERLEQPAYIMEENPTAEAIAKLIYQVAKKQGFPIVEVRLWETPTSYARYKE